MLKLVIALVALLYLAIGAGIGWALYRADGGEFDLSLFFQVMFVWPVFLFR